MVYLSHSPQDTQKFAGKQALELTRKGKGKPLVIALEGELGAGKTTFVQAFAKALGVKDRLKSPTFVLMKHYQIKGVTGYDTLYHLDCYRLNEVADLEPLGAEEIINRPNTIILIEWAERVAGILPKNYWLVHIDHVAEQERNIKLELR